MRRFHCPLLLAFRVFCNRKKSFVYQYLGKIFIFNPDHFGALELPWSPTLISIHDDEEDPLAKLDLFVYTKNNLYPNAL